MQTQNGYGLPQSRLAAATAAARYLDEICQKLPSPKPDEQSGSPSAPSIN